MNRLMSTNELAEVLGLHPQTVRVWRISGDGPPYVKLGEGKRGRVRYDVDKVREWLATRERES